jgi:alkaline phosphatase D
MRKLQEIQPLLASTINLAIWDDHDYGPNDSDRSFIGKTISRKVFQEFWGNPTYGVENQGTASFYEWGDVQFFLTDNRWFRSPNEMKSAKRDCFGESQLNALIESLISSNSRRLSKFDNKDYLGKDCFKFVCVGGQILNDVPVYENLILIAPHERDTLLARIARENIKNVVFLSGDRHHSELSKKMLLSAKGDSIAVYDWTVSPLTSSVASGEKEPNTYQVPDSYFRQRCFGTMDITGNQNARTLRLALCDTLGKSFWNYEIQAAH